MQILEVIHQTQYQNSCDVYGQYLSLPINLDIDVFKLFDELKTSFLVCKYISNGPV